MKNKLVTFIVFLDSLSNQQFSVQNFSQPKYYSFANNYQKSKCSSKLQITKWHMV